MLRNYFKTGIRIIIRNKFHSLINISGLAIGIAVFILIMLFARNEFSYDKFHTNYKNIYKLGIGDRSCMHGALPELIREEFPEIISTFRLWKFANQTPIIIYEDKHFIVENYSYVDSSLFDIFSFELIRGNPDKFLVVPYSIVLTKSEADKIFGEDDPIGKIISMNDELNLTVTGVIQNVPHNSSNHFNALISLSTLEQVGWKINDNWMDAMFDTFVLLQNNVDHESTIEKINSFMVDYCRKEFNDELENDFLIFRTLNEVYFKQDLEWDQAKHGNLTAVKIFIAAGILILIIAIINFINLSTAKSAIRAKEIAIRKITGSGKSRIIQQFLLEAIIISIISTLLAVILVEILRPYVNDLAGSNFKIGYMENPLIILYLFLFSVLIGFIAGIYPALYLTSFKPLEIIRKKMISGHKGNILRNILIIFQFTVSLILISGTLIISKQLKHIRNVDIGLNKENLIYFEIKTDMNQDQSVFKEELLKHPDITEVAYSWKIPGRQLTRWGRTLFDKNIKYYVMFVDPDYIDLMDMEIVEGRNFSWDIPTDIDNVMLVNETAVREWELEDPIGTKIPTMNNKTAEIVGIVKDFCFESLHSRVEPIGIICDNDPDFVNIKISTEDYDKVFKYIEEKWDEFVDAPYPFDPVFLDDDLNTLYNNELKLGRILSYFSIIAIFIACIGILGVIAFICERRIKEIGIRKVNGASVRSLVMLISSDIIKMILISLIISIPVSYFAIDKWLQNFAFQVNISLLIFIFAGLLLTTIALLTVSFEAIRTATKNPADTLKYE